MEIRASDQDRERAVAALQRHTGAGRLTLDEFTARVDAACSARTVGELGALLGDLPAEPADDEPGTPPGDNHRELLLVFAIAVLTLLALGAFVTLSRR